MQELWVSRTRGYEPWRASLAICLPCDNMDKREIPFPTCPSAPTVGGRPSLGIMRVAELALLLTSFSTPRPCTLPGQHNKGDPGGGRASQPQDHEHGELGLPLVCCVVTWALEKCPSLTLYHLQQAGELALSSSEWESWSCPSPTAALERMGPAPPLNSTVELILWGSWVTRP